MTGPEVSVEAMTVNGETTVITITDKVTTPPPFFVEIGHSEPSALPQDIKDHIVEITKATTKAMGLKNCPSHTEMKLTKDGPKIVETAARLGGDFITSRLVPLSTGVDMVGNSILLATGAGVNLEKKWNKGAAICFIQGHAGTLQNIEIDETLSKTPGIEEIVFYKQPGEKIHNTESSNDRLGHVIATAPSAGEALELAREVCGRIAVSIF